MDTIKPLFTATATATGGRNGHTQASDGSVSGLMMSIGSSLGIKKSTCLRSTMHGNSIGNSIASVPALQKWWRIKVAVFAVREGEIGVAAGTSRPIAAHMLPALRVGIGVRHVAVEAALVVGHPLSGSGGLRACQRSQDQQKRRQRTRRHFSVSRSNVQSNKASGGKKAPYHSAALRVAKKRFSGRGRPRLSRSVLPS